MRSSQQEHLVHRVIKYCWAEPKLLVESLVWLSGLTPIALCLVVPGFAHWENTYLLNLFCGHSRSLRPNSYHSWLPSGAGLKPKVCLRHQNTTVVFQARLVGFGQCKSLETDLALDIFSFSQFSRQVSMETLCKQNTDLCFVYFQ